MQHSYSRAAHAAHICASALTGCCFLLLALLLPRLAQAQAPVPAWSAATIGSSTQLNGTSTARATAVDAAGNVFVTGFFSGQVAFGSTVLSSAGGQDLFVAKYVPATATWTWAQSGGGANSDQGSGIAVSGTSVYVTGYLTNNTANVTGVLFGGTGTTAGTVQVNGATATNSFDLVVAKYTDNGTTATLDWTQVGGGTGADLGLGLAVNGPSVYVTGFITNSTGNGNGVLFGGTGTTVGTVQQNGATATSSQDLVVAKYTDNGSTATLDWTQVGGGTGTDQGQGVAVNGPSVYVTGYLNNTTGNASGVLFGGTGTTVGTVRQHGATATISQDLVIAKYTDNGATATLNWTQVGGGTSVDQGLGIAVSGSSVYVAGFITNSTGNGVGVLFGGTGFTAGAVQVNGATATISQDLVVVKYTDNGATATLNWTQVGGGTGADRGQGLAVSGSSVYVTGYLTNSTANGTGVLFGGTDTTAGTVQVNGATASNSTDLVVARYTDNGATATLNWTQVGGGTSQDQGLGIAVSSSSVYVAGYIGASGAATFGTAAGAPLLGIADNQAVLATLTDNGSTGPWQTLAAADNGGTSQTRATAVDAAGNVFVTGNFTGQVAFGSTVLSSAGSQDLFVAKYVPATATWAWAQSGGGTNFDQGQGITVSGSSVYVTGLITNTTANGNAVVFGGTGPTTSTAVQHGTSTATNTDLIVAKYTDNGSTATLGWTQVGGGTGDDRGNGIAVSGSSVYVTGFITNTTANASAVVFGGAGTTAGTVQQNGASTGSSPDLVVAKYTDNGSTATLGWTQVGGGRSNDQGLGIAVNGPSVYVTGFISNSTGNNSTVVFGGTGITAGTVRQNGATATNSNDLVVAKYTDNGTTATLGWTQVGGGANTDQGFGIAVSGSNVYVTGYLANSTGNASGAVFGSTGTTAGTMQVNGATPSNSTDLVVARYTDNGATATLDWTQVGGGVNTDQGLGLAVSGSNVYVTGFITNNTANASGVLFGGTGTTAGTVQVNGASALNSNDLVVAKYTDNGSTATLDWIQVGGGTGLDQGLGLAVSGSTVYVAGYIIPSATFGSFTIANPVGGTTNFLGELLDAVPLPVELTQFTAAPEGAQAVRLAWATASEVNSAAFVVERSLDGRTFAAVGRVPAAGSSSAPRSYTMLDQQLPAGAAVLYYRLQQVDQDGTYSYSPVRAVALGRSLLTGLTLAPNPSTGVATLRGAAALAPVRVYDGLGRLVLTATADATGTARLVLPARQPGGVYVVRSGAQATRLVLE